MKMLNIFEDYITDNFKCYKGLIIEESLKIDDKKISVVFCYKNSIMISIELVIEGYCDIMIIDIKSEEITFSETTLHKSFATLKEYIDSFFYDKVLM